MNNFCRIVPTSVLFSRLSIQKQAKEMEGRA